jgi:chlorobactene glucosyltransferase
MIRWDDPALSAVLAGAFLMLLTLVWGGLTLGVGRWGQAWRLRPEDADGDGAEPLVSICVPARDEAGRIGRCVEAALASTYRRIEVVVVDDRSSDGTGEEASAAAGGDPRVRVIQGTEPLRGWAGKPWACMRAAGEAQGDLLLFIDADVELAPWAVAASVRRLQRDELEALSLFGDWRLESFWEIAVVPVIGWFIRGAVDLDAVNDRGRPEAFANGQFILITRPAYDAIGGAVRAEVLDDVRLARALKSRALPLGLRFAPGAFRVRLYESLSQIVAGYSKNLYEGMDRKPLLASGALLFVFVTTVLPYLLALALVLAVLTAGWHPGGPMWWGWLAADIALIHVFRYRLERADGRSGLHALSHPLGNLVFVYILVRSMMGLEQSWKGRRFVDGKAEG